MNKCKLKLITKILVIIVISLISFTGIYVQKYNKMENVVKGYDLSKDLSGYRQILIELSDATEVLDSDGKVIGNTDQYDSEAIKTNSYKKSKNLVNKEENINKQNFEKAKKIIEERLKLLGVQDYHFSMDRETGVMYIQIPENDNTDYVISNVLERGSFEIKDSEDGTTYITREHLQEASALYRTTENGTIVYLHIQLNKEGKSILKDLSENQYATIKEEVVVEETTNETAEEKKEDSKKSDSKKSEEESEETKQKQISLAISGNSMITSSFDDPIQDGVIDLSMNAASKSNDEINETLRTTSTIATILQTGELPLVYKITLNQYVSTDISDVVIRNTIIIFGVILTVLLVFMIIKNKLKGLLGVISYIGFVAIYLLLVRYTNVIISISGAIAIALVCIINYLINMKLLPVYSDKKVFKQEYLKIIIKMIPMFIISIIFIFMDWTLLSSFGMLLFWGVILMSIYNLLVTKKIVG